MVSALVVPCDGLLRASLSFVHFQQPRDVVGDRQRFFQLPVSYNVHESILVFRGAFALSAGIAGSQHREKCSSFMTPKR